MTKGELFDLLKNVKNDTEIVIEHESDGYLRIDKIKPVKTTVSKQWKMQFLQGKSN